MKLVYLTGQRYPSRKTDPFFHRSMARAFSALLGGDLTFVIRGALPGESINTLALSVPDIGRSVWYFVRLPYLFLTRWNTRDTVILCYDPNLLFIVLFWRSILGLRFRVASEWHQLFGDWRDRYIARRNDYLFATSARLKSLLIERCGAAAQKITVAYGGVDPRPFREAPPAGALRESLQLPEGFLVGYVGIFTSVGLPKGLDTMLEALPLLPEDVSMVLVGGNPQELEAYRALAERLGVSKRCILVPKQPFEKVVEYQSALDALVIPYPDRPHFRDFGFPMKVWEYMAAGRPIIYSNLAIMNEILKGRGSAFEPGNARDLARVIEEVRRSPDAVSARNREGVERYTWEARAKLMLNALS